MIEESAEVTLPTFLSNFEFQKFELVKVEKIYVGERSRTGKITYVPIKKTPHFRFASALVENQNNKLIEARYIYEEYLKIYKTQHSSECFTKLYQSIQSSGYKWETAPIFVWNNWRRPFPLYRRDVADGFHRLSILAALGQMQIMVARLVHSDSYIERLRKRLIAI
jgi:hypothetical protein